LPARARATPSPNSPILAAVVADAIELAADYVGECGEKILFAALNFGVSVSRILFDATVEQARKGRLWVLYGGME
jgi:hypothetical protein